ncbi:hypothetical protein EYF80_032700 [Liparis tanakae]|uniref:Uncharacterized protein n=1 Tax=Liparis tanakae TaxID=230148 RepID=A0A4Z2GVJ7_9TELE|nr:hypothetical protein EYF80_032700 [Liparis tanakae]
MSAIYKRKGEQTRLYSEMSFTPKSTEIMSSPHWFSSDPTWVQDLQELKTTAAARGTESLSYTFQLSLIRLADRKLDFFFWGQGLVFMSSCLHVFMSSHISLAVQPQRRPQLPESVRLKQVLDPIWDPTWTPSGAPNGTPPGPPPGPFLGTLMAPDLDPS